MIELPRAALTADEIATVAEFFSYGTNDLTQTTFGLSRDDAGKFLPEYVRREILPADPFETLDQVGVGKLVKMGVELGRSDPAEAEDRHLRRARRRAVVGGVLPPDGPRLRQLLAVPDPDRPPRRRPGGRPRRARRSPASPRRRPRPLRSRRRSPRRRRPQGPPRRRRPRRRARRRWPTPLGRPKAAPKKAVRSAPKAKPALKKLATKKPAKKAPARKGRK